MKKIIIQGDDWGYTPATIEGICAVYENGILSQTDVMVNLLDLDKADYYRQKIENLENKTKLEKSPLGVGVHLNLTYGQPLTESWPHAEMTRPFRGSGEDREWQGKAWATYFADFDSKLVEKEYRAQIERALDIFGSIDHLDAHHFTHSYSPMREIILDLSAEYDVAIRAAAPLSEKPVYGGDFIVDTDFVETAKQRGIPIPDHTILKWFWSSDDPVKNLIAELEAIPDNSTAEFMFHPAQGEGAKESGLVDYKILTDTSVIEFVASHNIELITFGDLS